MNGRDNHSQPVIIVQQRGMSFVSFLLIVLITCAIGLYGLGARFDVSGVALGRSLPQSAVSPATLQPQSIDDGVSSGLGCVLIAPFSAGIELCLQLDDPSQLVRTEDTGIEGNRVVTIAVPIASNSAWAPQQLLDTSEPSDCQRVISEVEGLLSGFSEKLNQSDPTVTYAVVSQPTLTCR